LSETTLL